MRFQIERTALKCLLNVLLSCRCPVSEKAEEDLINFFGTTTGQSVVDYEAVIKIANDKEGETVFDRLREFCTYSIENFSAAPVISVDDVLRHFCTAYHWHVIEDFLPKSYKDLTDVPSWFTSHMLLPVELTVDDGTVAGIFSHSERSISLIGLFLPSDIQLKEGSLYCAHFASVITEVSRHQFELIRSHLEDISQFRNLSAQVFTIDFRHFQRFGDYSAFCRERYQKYF
jgi:hypothetical protein